MCLHRQQCGGNAVEVCNFLLYLLNVTDYIWQSTTMGRQPVPLVIIASIATVRLAVNPFPPCVNICVLPAWYSQCLPGAGSARTQSWRYGGAFGVGNNGNSGFNVYTVRLFGIHENKIHMMIFNVIGL